MTAPLRRVVDGLVDLVFPRRCVACGVAGAWLCPSCAQGLEPIGAGCLRCGAPARRPLAGCPECRGRELAFASARAAFRYEGPARRLVTACKFRSFRSLADEMSELAGGAFERCIAALAGAAPVDAVTWVPVHGDRRLERGFDQAELLARRLAAHAGLPAVPLLRRRPGGRRQSGLGAAQRAENVRAAFAVDERALRKAGTVKKLVIVDDVYTTGETLHECSLGLRSAGLVPHAFAFARAARLRR